MKNFVLLAGSILSVASFAVDSPKVSPNKYDCVGNDNTQVNYTTTSRMGKPTMRVVFKGRTAKLAPIPEINKQQSMIGNLVTVTDNSMVPVDGPSVRYTLVLPTITLKDGSSAEELKTVVVRTSVANPFFRPTPFTGAVEHNTIEEVTCSAERVFF